MKKIVLMLLVSSCAWAESEKVADTREYQVAAPDRAFVAPGNLDGTNTYDRVFSDGSNGGSCDYVGTDSGNDGVGYQTFEFHTPTGELADMEVVLGTLGDSLLFIYCGGFDPANPNNNLVAIDDDGGAGLGSAFTPADGIMLDANVTYVAVVAGFSNTDLGTFDLNFGGDFVAGAPEPVSVPTLSTLALIVMMLAIFGFVYMRRPVKG